MKCRMSVSLLLTGLVSLSAAASSPVTVHEKNIVIPTYEAGPPELSPMFYFGRNSQGAEGRVYPYPLYDTLTYKKVDKTYRIVYLENEYIRIGVLPEIGGRLFEGVDKSNNYNFIYRQHVIKPALIGLIGAWISGGIEWNIPHHHRASTFLPVQYRVEENADGSKTVWVGELEVRQRMRWAVGYTLHPGKSYLEAQVRVVNRTPVANTMLCFANVAVSANENYQIIFPPSTQWVTFHAKNQFSQWPISHQRYSGADFTQGVDVSWYKNHLAANSMFAWNYEDDFFAGYDHGREAGTMSVADHHIVPGKKFWTWGNGPRGKMWDKILTDDDGPYIELMVGAYSDNQPDYSWLQPFETRAFPMYWYPFHSIGGVKKANLDAAVNLDVTNGIAKVGFCTTSAHPSALVTVKAGTTTLIEEHIAIHPAKPYTKQIPVPAGVDEHDLIASLSADGKTLVSYSPVRLEETPMPEAVQPPAEPKDIKTVQELYLTGLRIEQFHSPALEPEPYWEEALRRDPNDTQVNTALGITDFKKARFAEAEKLFRTALTRLTDKYTDPKDGEAIYYLGLTLKALGKTDEAFDMFYKATWNAAWKSPAYCSLAEIATMRGNLDAALEFVNRAIDADAANIRAVNLKAALLRHLGRKQEALALLASSAHKTDPLDTRSMAERWLASGKPADAKPLVDTLNRFPATAQETAAEYLNAGFYEDGAKVLSEAIANVRDELHLSPMVYYYLAAFAAKLGQPQKATDYRRLAVQMPPDYAFPFQDEAIGVLREAIRANPQDARAPYYLGNLLFDWQPDEAVRLWKQSAALDPGFSIVHRNLGIALSHRPQSNDLPQAIVELEKAVALPNRDPIYFTELDELYEASGASPEKRLAILAPNHDVVTRRDDALSREIGMKVFAGDYDAAIRLMTGRRFAVWEGGSLDVVEHWVNAHLQRGNREFAAGNFREALADYQAANDIPDNLPTERRGGSHNAEINYAIGNAYEAMGDTTRAKQFWHDAATAESSGFGGRRGGGPAPAPGGSGRRGGRGGGLVADRNIQRYYQALARRKLGETEQADAILHELAGTIVDASDPASFVDLSAMFSVAQSQRSRLANTHYVAGLGHLGLGETDKAKQEFAIALQISPDHLGAKTTLEKMQ